jgi:hypothetical protein
MVGSLRAKLVSRLERRRSMLFLTGVPEPDAAVEERRPALRVAAAWREDKEGECGLRGDGGPPWWCGCGCDMFPFVFVGEMRGRWGREAVMLSTGLRSDVMLLECEVSR